MISSDSQVDGLSLAPPALHLPAGCGSTRGKAGRETKMGEGEAAALSQRFGKPL